MVRQSIKILAVIELLILFTYIYSFEFFINLQIAFLSSLFIMLGSMYAYKKMVGKKVESEHYEENRDQLYEIDDPYELYDDEPLNEAPAEELDIKQIVKDEKKKIKVLNFKTIKEGGGAGFSPFRIVPYIFLILGFIALKNNGVLNIAVYLPSLLVGIIGGYISGKKLFYGDS